MTWPQDVYAFGGDKQWIAIDRTEGIGRGNVYHFWTPFISATCCPGLTFTRSVDGGLTWMAPMAVPDQQFANTVAVGPDGAVYNFGSTFIHSPPRFSLVRSRRRSPRHRSPGRKLPSHPDAGSQSGADGCIR